MKKKNKNKGVVFWITGLPGSGKTTIAKKIKKQIEKNFGKTVLFSGDDLRKILKLKDYNKKKRYEYARIYSNLVKQISNQNINVIIATVALFRKIHKLNKQNIENYCEIFIKFNINNIIKNKKKNLYFKNKKNLVGLDIKPEYPIKPHIEVINNFADSTDKISKKILGKVNFLYKIR